MDQFEACSPPKDVEGDTFKVKICVSLQRWDMQVRKINARRPAGLKLMFSGKRIKKLLSPSHV